MSALAIVPAGDAIVLAADGAVYDRQRGQLLGSITKLHVMPHLSTVFGAVGQGHLIHIFPHLIGFRFSSFDEVRENFAELCRASVSAQRTNNQWEDRARATVVLAGWSEGNQAFEVFKLHTLDKFEHSAWDLHPISGVWCSTAPTPEHMDEVSLDANADSALDVAAKLVCANRLQSGAGVYEGDDYGEEDAYGVGCFLQMALLRRDCVTSWIAHRWPDENGKVINPETGEKMPAFPIQKP